MREKKGTAGTDREGKKSLGKKNRDKEGEVEKKKEVVNNNTCRGNAKQRGSKEGRKGGRKEGRKEGEKEGRKKEREKEREKMRPKEKPHNVVIKKEMKEGMNKMVE